MTDPTYNTLETSEFEPLAKAWHALMAHRKSPRIPGEHFDAWRLEQGRLIAAHQEAYLAAPITARERALVEAGSSSFSTFTPAQAWCQVTWGGA